MTEWGEWRYPPEKPNVGDYVQIKIVCLVCSNKNILEGFVSVSTNIEILLTPTIRPKKLDCPFAIEKWRRAENGVEQEHTESIKEDV